MIDIICSRYPAIHIIMSQWPGITWRGYASFWGVIRRSIVAKYYIVVIVIQWLSHVWLFVTSWTAAYQASLYFTISQSLLNSCPLSKWCYPTISSSVTLFSSCLQSFPALESSPKSWLFTSGSQSIEALASVFPVNIQGWFPLGLTGLILQSKGLWRVFSSTTIWMHYDAWVICLTFVSSHGHFIISHHHKKDENISLWYIERETIFTVFLLQYIVIIFYLNIVNPLQYLIYNLNIIIGMYV